MRKYCLSLRAHEWNSFNGRVSSCFHPLAKLKFCQKIESVICFKLNFTILDHHI